MKPNAEGKIDEGDADGQSEFADQYADQASLEDECVEEKKEDDDDCKH
jgi:hypothetical protein